MQATYHKSHVVAIEKLFLQIPAQGLGGVQQNCTGHCGIRGPHKSRIIGEVLAVVVAGQSQEVLGLGIYGTHNIGERKLSENWNSLLELIHFRLKAKAAQRLYQVLAHLLVMLIL